MDAATFSDQAADHFDRAPGKIFIPRATNGLNTGENNVSYKYDSEADAFPVVDAGHIPLGSLLLVQVRQPKLRTAGGIILDTELRKTEQHNTQVAKVIAIGPLAFKNRNTSDPWPEGAWAKPGDYVRIPKYQGDRFVVPYARSDYDINIAGDRVETKVEDSAEFVLIKDLSLLASIPDPLTVRAFL